MAQQLDRVKLEKIFAVKGIDDIFFTDFLIQKDFLEQKKMDQSNLSCNSCGKFQD